ncbi:hypothetical protein ACE103_09085 [Bradyrhizobium sp. ma5]
MGCWQTNYNVTRPHSHLRWKATPECCLLVQRSAWRASELLQN